jgi:hypothetical protein
MGAEGDTIGFSMYDLSGNPITIDLVLLYLMIACRLSIEAKTLLVKLGVKFLRMIR